MNALFSVVLLKINLLTYFYVRTYAVMERASLSNL